MRNETHDVLLLSSRDSAYVFAHTQTAHTSYLRLSVGEIRASGGMHTIQTQASRNVVIGTPSSLFFVASGETIQLHRNFIGP